MQQEFGVQRDAGPKANDRIFVFVTTKIIVLILWQFVSKSANEVKRGDDRTFHSKAKNGDLILWVSTAFRGMQRPSHMDRYKSVIP